MSATTRMGAAVPSLLREAWGRHTAKHAARAAGVAYETSRDWVKGRSLPNAATLLAMAERDERMAAALEARLHDLRAARRAALRTHPVAPGEDRSGAVAGGPAAEVSR